MKSKIQLMVFFAVYILIPLIIIPILCFKFNNWYGLIGIPLFYSGIITSYFKQAILLAVPILFCLWYWYTYSFGFTDYVTVYFVCLMSGFFIYEAKKGFEKLVFKVIPEQEQNLDFNDKLRQMEIKIEEYKKKNPNEKVTQEIVEQIKTEIFF